MIELNYNREEWAKARAEGRLYPGGPKDEWRSLGEITAELVAGIARRRQASEAAE